MEDLRDKQRQNIRHQGKIEGQTEWMDPNSHKGEVDGWTEEGQNIAYIRLKTRAAE